MKLAQSGLVVASLTLLAFGALNAAVDAPPTWAFQTAEPGSQRAPDTGEVKHVPGSTAGFTMTQIDDPFTPPDWYPDEHPPMPDLVSKGRKPAIRACAQCHLPNGLGHPESSALAGLTAEYIVDQMNDYKKGLRKSSPIMVALAKAATPEEIQATADYYSTLKYTKWTTVVETTTVPKTFVALGNMRFAYADRGTEPLGRRIIELPADPGRVVLRDSHSPFVANVPVGSVNAGESLVVRGARGSDGTTTGGVTIACDICHGEGLRGLGHVPAIAGRSPLYVMRQLYDIQHGSRNGKNAELMHAAVAKLTLDDMLDISAYVASLAP